MSFDIIRLTFHTKLHLLSVLPLTNLNRHSHKGYEILLHCALSIAAQCIVISPVCLCVDVFVCGSVTTITRNCVHRSSPNWVCR